jgi:hypothetical protein
MEAGFWIHKILLSIVLSVAGLSYLLTQIVKERLRNGYHNLRNLLRQSPRGPDREGVE